MDLDPQGHCGLGLGIDVDSLDRSIYDTFLNGTHNLTETILSVKPHLDILPANIELAALETELVNDSHRTTKLVERLQSIKHLYEYIIIDCPPSIGLLTINALVASHMVLVPVQSSFSGDRWNADGDPLVGHQGLSPLDPFRGKTSGIMDRQGKGKICFR
jgi:chromosome partitioning protein